MSGTAAFGRPAAAAGGTERLVFLDVLRVLIISMVIVHHAAQAYGPTGGFWPVKDAATSDWFRPFYTVNAAVGLGLLFLLAGFFLPRSYDRKGSRRFLRERWARIGVPLVFFVLVVNIAAAVYSIQALGFWDVLTATGGLDWRSLVRVTLEILVCAGLSVGLVVAFREVFHQPRRFLAAMATASYAAYILHVFVVGGLQAAILQAPWPAGAKFAIVAVLGIVLSFGIGHVSRFVPGVRVLLGTSPPHAKRPRVPGGRGGRRGSTSGSS